MRLRPVRATGYMARTLDRGLGLKCSAPRAAHSREITIRQPGEDGTSMMSLHDAEEAREKFLTLSTSRQKMLTRDLSASRYNSTKMDKGQTQENRASVKWQEKV
jgi:hypothetical protein